MSPWSPVVELRRYTMRPGGRDVLIGLFDERFIEPQEDLGMKLIGQFRELDDPERFTWIRGFPDLAGRGPSLRAFYTGPVWKENREAANATMIDVDDVLLLRPARPGSAFGLPAQRPPRGASDDDRGVVEVTISHLQPHASLDRGESAERQAAELAAAGGGGLLAAFVTLHAPNDFPTLPVREDAHVVVWFVGFPDRRSWESAHDSGVCEEIARVAGTIPGAIGRRDIVRLAPTPRSLLAGAPIDCLAPA